MEILPPRTIGVFSLIDKDYDDINNNNNSFTTCPTFYFSVQTRIRHPWGERLYWKQTGKDWPKHHSWTTPTCGCGPKKKKTQGKAPPFTPQRKIYG